MSVTMSLTVPNTPHRGIRIDDELWREFQAATATAGTNPSETIRQLVREWVNKRKANQMTNPTPAIPTEAIEAAALVYERTTGVRDTLTTENMLEAAAKYMHATQGKE